MLLVMSKSASAAVPSQTDTPYVHSWNRPNCRPKRKILAVAPIEKPSWMNEQSTIGNEIHHLRPEITWTR